MMPPGDHHNRGDGRRRETPRKAKAPPTTPPKSEYIVGSTSAFATPLHGSLYPNRFDCLINDNLFSIKCQEKYETKLGIIRLIYLYLFPVKSSALN